MATSPRPDLNRIQRKSIMPEMAFQPSLHGWPFANGFHFPSHLLGMNRPLPDSFGLCGGMCWTALDRYLAARPIARDVPAPAAGEPLHAELILRQVNALSRDVWNRVVAWQCQPVRRRGVGTPGVASGQGREWKRLRQSLDTGFPVLLCVVLDSGPFATPADTHQVLAYGYAHDREARRIRIRVYDPNHPGDDERSLTLALGRTGTPSRITLDGHGTVHGFLVVAYDRPAPPRLHVESFAERGRVTFNHPILDRPSVLAGADGNLDLFGRDRDGNLIRYRRGTEGAWGRQNLTLETGASPTERLHGRPVVLDTGRTATIFARNIDGDVLQYRRSTARGWRVRNLTDPRRTGPRYRLAQDPVAVAGPGRRTTLVGVTPEGRLVLYEWAPVRGWAAAEPATSAGDAEGPVLEGRPVAVIGPEDSLHVLVRDRDGRLIHFRRGAGDAPWSVAPVPTDPTSGAALRIVGDPAVAADEGTLAIVARDGDGRLLHGHWTTSAGWDVSALTGSDEDGLDDALRVDSDPALIDAGETLHVFARSVEGGLVHGRRVRDDHWLVENVTLSRATIDRSLTIDDAPVACAGAKGTLLVAGTRRRELVLYTWRPESDWSAEAVATARKSGFETCADTERLVALAGDDDRRGHVFGTDADGTVFHLEIVPDGGEAGSRRSLDERTGKRKDEVDAEARATDRSHDRRPAPGRTGGPEAAHPTSRRTSPGRRRSTRRPDPLAGLPELPLLEDPPEDETVGPDELPILELPEASIVEEPGGSGRE